jgi:hypothetical protein
MFRSYDHHQAEKYIATLGLLNWQRIRCFIISYIIVIAYILLCITRPYPSNGKEIHIQTRTNGKKLRDVTLRWAQVSLYIPTCQV